MTKLTLSVLILAGVILTAGAVYTGVAEGEQNTESVPAQVRVSEVPKATTAKQVSEVAELDKSTNSVLKKQITKTVDYLRTGAMYDSRYLWSISSRLNDLSAIKSAYPVELTERVDDNTMYAVFRRHDKNIGDYYSYVFFRHEKPLSAEEKSAMEEEGVTFLPMTEEEAADVLWQIAGREVRISKRLSVKDFTGISVGATIKNVTAVDPITAVSIPPEDYIGSNPVLSFNTFHYTDEGILRISFERKTVHDEFLVSETELNSSFEVHPFDDWSGIIGKDLPNIVLKINPEHLPD